MQSPYYQSHILPIFDLLKKRFIDEDTGERRLRKVIENDPKATSLLDEYLFSTSFGLEEESMEENPWSLSMDPFVVEHSLS